MNEDYFGVKKLLLTKYNNLGSTIY